MLVRGIVFDLDGTLVDSLDDIAAALVAALADHGIAAPARATVRGWIGGGARNLVAQAAPHAVEAVLARFHAHYEAAPVVHTRVYPGLAPMLDRFAAAGIALAVLTNKPQPLATRIAEVLLAPWPFAVIAGERPGVPLKPSPVAALRIAAELGLSPEVCAVIGDSASDVETGRAAGMHAVAVTWGFRTRAELVAAQPELVFDDPAELASLA